MAADDKTKVYGSADPELTVSVPAGALESGDSLSGELVRSDGKDVGGYAITKGSLTAGGNYELTVTPGTLTITKKAASVTAGDKSKVYGSDDPELTTTDSGFLAPIWALTRSPSAPRALPASRSRVVRTRSRRPPRTRRPACSATTGGGGEPSRTRPAS